METIGLIGGMIMAKPSCLEELSEESFVDRVLRSELPVLVVVWIKGAEQELLTLLEEWAPRAGSRLGIFGFNAERSPGLVGRFGIPLAPGLALFNRGVLSYQFVGEVSRQELEEVLERGGGPKALEEGGGASGGREVEPPPVAD